jgi:AAA+ ATPase superfamily predicted ATPase
MKFINREKELELFGQIKKAIRQSSKMTVLVGRRRIGKTRLVWESLREETYLYIFSKPESINIKYVIEDNFLHCRSTLKAFLPRQYSVKILRKKSEFDGYFASSITIKKDIFNCLI